MQNLVFSLAKILGTEILSVGGLPLATLEDIVCNKDSGKITYLVLSTSEPEQLFAIHHSFFYFNNGEDSLTFDLKVGRDEHSFFLDLPDHYEESDVDDLNAFNGYISMHMRIATHRSDND